MQVKILYVISCYIFVSNYVSYENSNKIKQQDNTISFIDIEK